MSALILAISGNVRGGEEIRSETQEGGGKREMVRIKKGGK